MQESKVKNQKLKWGIIFIILLFAFGFQVRAEEVEKTEPVIITATRVETPVDHVTQSYTLISGEEISARQEESVLEVLRDVPGVNIVRSGTIGGNATAFLRGANTAQSLILIDGVEVNSPTVGSFDFGNLPVDSIERIEVIRGPQSTLYGSEAMGGVINVITKKGKGKPQITAEAEGGSNETARGYVRASGKKGIFDYSLSNSYLTTEGEFDNDAYENLNLGGNFGAALTEALHVDLMTRLTQARKEIQDFGLTSPDPNRFNRTESELVALKGDHWITEDWQHKLSLSWVHDRLTDRDPLNVGEFGSPLNTRITNEIWTIDYLHNYFWGDLQTITAGFEYEASSGKNVTTGDPFSGNFAFDKDLDNLAFYLQDQFSFWDRLFLVPGVRVDDHSIFGTEITPKVSGAFWVFPQTKLKSSWGKGFRAPSVNELLFPAFGSLDLEAEKSNAWEVGVEQTFLEGKTGLDLVYFRNDFEDLIAFEVVSVDPFIGRANNISEAKTEGVELSGFVKPCNAVTLKGSWTHLEAEDEITGETLPRRPEDSGSLEMTLKWQKFTLLTNATLVGERPDFGKELESYIKLDAVVSYEVNDHWAPYLKVQNVLDDDYEEAAGFPAPGFLIFGGVRVEI